MKILSKIKNRIFSKSDDTDSKRFVALKGFRIDDVNWKLTDASGNFWKPSLAGPRPLGPFKPSDRGTLYLDLTIYENKLHAITQLMKTISYQTHVNEDDTRYVIDAKCKITNLEVKNSEAGLFETLLSIAEARGYLFPSED